MQKRTTSNLKIVFRKRMSSFLRKKDASFFCSMVSFCSDGCVLSLQTQILIYKIFVTIYEKISHILFTNRENEV